MQREHAARARRWGLGLGVPLLLLGVTTRQVNPQEGLRLLAETGPLAALALLPFLLAAGGRSPAAPPGSDLTEKLHAERTVVTARP